MLKDKSIYLIVLQGLLLTGLFVIDINRQPVNPLSWILLILLLSVTGVLLFIRFNFQAQQKQMIIELKRVIDGNLNTRLLTGNTDLLDEFVFSINQLIEQLDNLQIQSIKSDAVRKRLLSNFSHDIRTPLTSIIGYVDALKDDVGASEEEKQEYIEIILRKANALKLLIEEVFHMAKLDADEVPLQMETLDFAEITREAVIDFLPELSQHGMELKADIPGKKCPVVADRLSLQRAIGNMVKNAIQYGKEGKVLGIELVECAGEYRLSIWDKGPGIAKEDLSNIFKRMYRADQSRNTANRGSGLGLAIAKALVEKNGGKIWAESAPGEKTTFSFSLPAKINLSRFKK